ncbi:hypothetical protein MRX96_018552 [Rhipicephalus microplus]
MAEQMARVRDGADLCRDGEWMPRRLPAPEKTLGAKGTQGDAGSIYVDGMRIVPYIPRDRDEKVDRMWQDGGICPVVRLSGFEKLSLRS